MLTRHAAARVPARMDDAATGKRIRDLPLKNHKLTA
jgi:hypothetical protein